MNPSLSGSSSASAANTFPVMQWMLNGNLLNPLKRNTDDIKSF